MYPASASNATAGGGGGGVGGGGATSSSTASKFQTHCVSPQFASFGQQQQMPSTSLGDYPHPHHQTTSAAIHQAPPPPPPSAAAAAAAAAAMIGHGSMSMRHGQRVTGSQMSHNHGHQHGTTAATLAHHHHQHHQQQQQQHQGHVIFPDDMDSIEFCMPPAAPPSASSSTSASSSQQNGGGGGEQLLLGHQHGEAFTERRRRGYSRRSNHKMDVEQQVKWSRKNIAATMERFEPTINNTQSSSSTSSLDYGFAAGVMTPSGVNSVTPSHMGGGGTLSSTPSLHVAYNGGGGGGGGLGGGAASASSGLAAGASATAPFNHVYSYAYYEPGAAKCHTNVPANGMPQLAPIVQAPPSKSSIRALLAKSFRSKSSSSHGGGGHQSTSSSPSGAEEQRDRDGGRHTYTTRYGTTENLYEEVSEQKIRKVLSDNRIASSSVGNVKEEQRRVQHNHFRVLDELNLSLEALIMPPTPPDISPSHAVAGGSSPSEEHLKLQQQQLTGSVSGSASNSGTVKSVQRPRRGGLLGGAATTSSAAAVAAAASSLENLSTHLNSMELKDHHHHHIGGHSSCINPEFDEGDLDSGFSGSGSSSGASYNESLRYYKSATNHHTTGNLTQNHQHHQQHQQNHNHHHQHNNNNNNNNNNTLPLNMRSCRSSTASATTSTSKSSMASCGEDQGISGMTGMGGIMDISSSAVSPFSYPRRCSADQQRASARSMSSQSGAATGISVPCTGTKPKKNFWTMKP
ncbi:rho GTPase-activating protein gacZ-like [Drosophila willistoni]|uniref:rho GTPase-activating protein gacZ-like n=1 Tax=Drosophila willistoni TaxID=7260 RepID=UPI00017D8B91|nr:rho GTPase-activating protein gacZ-like [Drosophila willistoni]